MEKLCNACGLSKPLDLMTRQGQRVTSRCKACSAERARAHYYNKVRPATVNIALTEATRAAIKEAREKGEKFYKSDRPCNRGHVGLRSTQSQQCAACQKEDRLARFDRDKCYRKKKAMVKRKVAGQLGKTHYFTGDPCKNGHVANRLVSTRQCVECLSERKPPKAKGSTPAQNARSNASRRSRAGKARNKDYYRRKLQNCTLHRLTCFMRACLRRCFTAKGDERTREILGYVPSELKIHLESQFVEGMTWDNYGEWHIDHRKPISLYLKEGILDPKEVNRLSNLAPLWGRDNLAKGSSYSDISAPTPR